MKKYKRKATSIILICLLSFFSYSCRDMIHDIKQISADIPQLESISMIEINDVENGGTTGLNSFCINRYETTYILWYEVFEWAKDNGFRFIKNGEDGNKGYTGKPDIYGLLPVTCLHPADIFVWCNALSVKNGLNPVYYTDNKCTNYLKEASEIADENYIINQNIQMDAEGNTVKYDFSLSSSFYEKTDSNGYRLPLTSEWQYAAQGARRTSLDCSYKYAGSNNYTEVTSTTKMMIPGSYKANGIGAYDMSGNVCEYCITGTTSSDSNIMIINEDMIHCYGGHYLDPTESILSVQKLNDLKNIIETYTYLFGFRIARNLN